MGGSGRGIKKRRKHTVDECIQIDASRMKKKLPFCTIQPAAREFRWLARPVIRFGAFVELKYAVHQQGFSQEVHELITLQRIFPRIGGERWWLTCPGCLQRAGKLYLPPGTSRFRCRKCHGLTYKSCQKRIRRDRSDELV